MKKPLFLLFFFILAGTPVFAAGFPDVLTDVLTNVLSGLGLGFEMGFDGSAIKMERSDDSINAQQSYRSIPYGGFFTFLDFKYAEASLGFSGVNELVKSNPNFWKQEEGEGGTGWDNEDVTLSGGKVVLSALGKYPFQVSGLTVYPVLGFEFDIYVFMKYTKDLPQWGKTKGDSYPGDAADWFSFWFKFGAGADYFLSDSLFVRAGFTFGIKAYSPRENKIISMMKDWGWELRNPKCGFGGRFTIALGYKVGEGGSSKMSFGSGGSNIYLPKQ